MRLENLRFKILRNDLHFLTSEGKLRRNECARERMKNKPLTPSSIHSTGHLRCYVYVIHIFNKIILK